jgi:CRP/FNR family cyclic AMP-dependent transcriptional regulator
MHRHEVLAQHLAGVPLFDGLSKKQLRMISQVSTPLEQPAGALLIQEGNVGQEFIVVIEGEIEIRQGERVIGVYGPGSYVGEIALLEKRPRTATVVAKTPVKLEVIAKREFDALLREVPELSQKVKATAAQRLADIER